MAKANSSTLPTASVRVYKYQVTNARRVVRAMNGPQTPRPTRRALREALERIRACTDLDKRLSLSRPEVVAVLLTVGVTRRPGPTWQRARAAHARLWEAFNAYDRVVSPRRWVLFDKVMRAYRERLTDRPRARRAPRPAPLRRRAEARA